jgi:predicted transcriptional regulator
MANRKKDKTLVRVTVSLDPDDYKTFEQIARQEDRPTAYLIRKAMRAFLDEMGRTAETR